MMYPYAYVLKYAYAYYFTDMVQPCISDLCFDEIN